MGDAYVNENWARKINYFIYVYYVMSKKHTIAVGIWLALGVLCWKWSVAQQQVSSHWKEKTEQVAKDSIASTMTSIDTLNHEKITQLSLENILTSYGEERGREIIKQYFLEEINETRKAHNLGPVVLHDTLMMTAQEYAEYCVQHKHISHFDLEKNDFNDRVKEHWYTREVSENISVSENMSIKGIIYDWLNNWSQWHRNNILYNTQEYIGIWGKFDGDSKRVRIILLVD